MERLGCAVSLTRGDACEALFPESSFNLIVAISIFEHIRDLIPVMRQAFRLLKPKGELLVGMPRVDQAMEKLFSLIGWHEAGAVHVTNHRQMLQIARGQGFTLERSAHLPSWTPDHAQSVTGWSAWDAPSH